MPVHPEPFPSSHPTAAPSARHGTAVSETGQSDRLPGDTVTVQSNLAACNTSVTETSAKDVAGGTLRGRSESPAKYGPIAVVERRKGGMFPLVGPSNFGYAVEFGRVQYRPHAEYIVRAVNCHDALLAALKAMLLGSGLLATHRAVIEARGAIAKAEAE